MLWTSYHHVVKPKHLLIFRTLAVVYGLAIQMSYIVWEIKWAVCTSKHPQIVKESEVLVSKRTHFV